MYLMKIISSLYFMVLNLLYDSVKLQILNVNLISNNIRGGSRYLLGCFKSFVRFYKSTLIYNISVYTYSI